MRDYDRFSSSHSVAEKLRAEIVEETSETYFVLYEDGDATTEPKTEKNRILFESDLINDPDDLTFSVIGKTLRLRDTITFEANLGTNVYELAMGDESLVLSEANAFEVLSLIVNDVSDREFIDLFEHSVGTDEADGYDEVLTYDGADAVNSYYFDLIAKQVRPAVIEQAMPRYGSRVEETDQGWIVDETFLVTFDAENYLVEDVQAHEVDRGGSRTVPVEDDNEFIDVTFDTQREQTVNVETVNGRSETVELTEREQRFLGTTECLCWPEEHLGTDLTHKIIDAVDDADDGLASIADTATVSRFKDPVTGLIHDHSLTKHTLAASFSVRSWVIDELYYSSFDHAGCHELLARKDEFVDDDRDIFFDGTRDESASRWSAVQAACKKALIPERVQRDIRNEIWIQ